MSEFRTRQVSSRGTFRKLFLENQTWESTDLEKAPGWLIKKFIFISRKRPSKKLGLENHFRKRIFVFGTHIVLKSYFRDRTQYNFGWRMLRLLSRISLLLSRISCLFDSAAFYIVFAFFCNASKSVGAALAWCSEQFRCSLLWSTPCPRHCSEARSRNRTFFSFFRCILDIFDSIQKLCSTSFPGGN